MSRILSLFGLQPTQHQLNVQARVIAYLEKYGGIDAPVQTLGTTSAHKLLGRLRDKGYLHPAKDPRGYVELANASGQGRYRWHRWTGKH
ncbi:hypothetical protein [Bradyrhizobium yuanmingense]|uniref:hypothetical protein n=1 Tax=Bradyrhizobium yuanmingense TaxID=108015 RepID=UPI0023B9D032|nr:hypothetical protein [Bradyrhizobium yuanmingense]MDF0584729.1 hypothetical protein [Bradyrhizobium yuanmingense]